MHNTSKHSYNYLSDILGKSISSLKFDRQDISLENHAIPPGENPEICVNKHIIGINTGQHVNMYMSQCGCAKNFSYLHGDLILVPAEVTVKAHVDRLHSSSSFNLTQDLLSRNALELWGVDKFELIPSFPIRDSLVKHLLKAINTELIANSDDCQIYVKSLSNSLAIHLLSKFSSRKYQATYTKGTLSSKKLKVILEYISSNLENKIKLEDMAKLSGYGQHHFSRAFKNSTGLSPHRYVIQERVNLAKKLLAQKKLSICEIAIACGFSHQSHLNRHFKRLVGMPPKAFQQCSSKRIGPQSP